MQMVEAVLDCFYARSQHRVGVNRKIKPHRPEFLGRNDRRNPAFNNIGDLNARNMTSDIRQLLARAWRLDE